LGFFISDYLTV